MSDRTVNRILAVVTFVLATLAFAGAHLFGLSAVQEVALGVGALAITVFL